MSDRTRQPSIARNAASQYGARGLVALTALALTPYLYRTLGEAAFGTWSVLLTLTMALDLLEFGFASGPARLIADRSARGDRAGQDRVVGASLVLTTGVGLGAAGLFATLAWLGKDLAADGQTTAFVHGLLIIAVAGVIRLACAAYAAALMGVQRWDLYNLAEAVKVLGFLVGAVVVVELGHGVEGLAWVFGVTLALSGLFQVALLRRADPGCRLLTRRSDLAELRTVGSFSSLTFLADAMVYVGQRADTLIIAGIAGARAAAPYAAVVRLQTGVQALTLPFMRLLLPMAAELAATEQRDEIRRRLLLATRIALQLTLPIAAGFALFSADIIDSWLGESVDDSAVWIVVALMGGQVIGLPAYAAERILVGIGRVRLLAALAVAEGLSNLALSIVLVHRMGAVGAAVSTLACTTVYGPLKLPLAMRALSSPDTRGETVRALLPAMQAAFPAVALMVAVFLVLDEGPLRLALGLAGGLGLALLLSLRQIGWSRLRAWRRRTPPGTSLPLG